MGDFLDFFKNKKNLINLLLLGILVLALPLGVDLIRQQQIIKSRAIADPIVFVGDNVEQRDGKWIAMKPLVSLELTSPLGPPASPAPSGSKFVLYWSNTPVSSRIPLEVKYGITWLNHAGLDAGVTLGAARSADPCTVAPYLIGLNYWPGYSVYSGDPKVANNADLSPYSKPPELAVWSGDFVLYWGSIPIPNRQALEQKYGISWLGHAGLDKGVTVGAARSGSPCIIGPTYWPGYSVYKGDLNVVNNADLAPYAKPQELK